MNHPDKYWLFKFKLDTDKILDTVKLSNLREIGLHI